MGVNWHSRPRGSVHACARACVCVWSGLCACALCAPKSRTRPVLPHSPDVPQRVSSAEGTCLLEAHCPLPRLWALLLSSVWNGRPERAVAAEQAAEPGQGRGAEEGAPPPVACRPHLVLSSWCSLCSLSPPRLTCRCWCVTQGPVLGSGPRAGVAVLRLALEVLPEGSPRQPHRTREVFQPRGQEIASKPVKQVSLSWRLFGDSRQLQAVSP